MIYHNEGTTISASSSNAHSSSADKTNIHQRPEQYSYLFPSRNMWLLTYDTSGYAQMSIPIILSSVQLSRNCNCRYNLTTNFLINRRGRLPSSCIIILLRDYIRPNSLSSDVHLLYWTIIHNS